MTGVGGKANIAGCGTVKLILTCNGHQYTVTLNNVIHVPGTKMNLISLGRWDEAGGWYTGGGGALILTTKDGK